MSFSILRDVTHTQSQSRRRARGLLPLHRLRSLSSKLPRLALLLALGLALPLAPNLDLALP